MKIKVTTEEREVLLSKLNLPQNLADLVRDSKLSGRNWTLDISEDDADTIRDLCGERLQEVGFDEKYELTPVGRILESLVDKFFIG